MQLIDDFLNRITMYRLTVWSLVMLLAAGFAESLLGVLSFAPVPFFFGTLFILSVCVASNEVFARMFNAPTNAESATITALILALIIPPMASGGDLGFLAFALFASAAAMASKFVFAVGRKHIFNPAAAGVAVTGLAAGMWASWWVGSGPMLPFVLVAGLLLVRKIRRFDLVLAFLAVAVFTILNGRETFVGIPGYLVRMAVDTPIFFFATVMLTEPLTTPPTRIRRIAYGGLVGVLFAPFIHVGSIYTTPELALLAGNIFSYIVSPKVKERLTLVRKTQLSPSVFDFAFAPERRFSFRPGQYLEWTFAHARADNRGNRRYFTIASAPSDREVHFGIKFEKNGSSFKKALAALAPGASIMVSGLAGDFTMPRDRRKKLAFLAGGIGVTPFTSMVRHLAAKNDRRNVVMIYSNQTRADISYQDVFEDARARIGLRMIYALTRETPPADPAYFGGRVTGAFIARQIPDYKQRHFYLSGTHAMVEGFRSALAEIGVPKHRIVTDFFPGFA